MCDSKRKPHVHAVLICEWAKGAVIQYRNIEVGWVDCKNNRPEWIDTLEYRIKPEPSDLEKYGVCVGDLWLL